MQFKRLLEEVVGEEDLFSPFYQPVRFLEPQEVEYLLDHESNPSAVFFDTPPAQVEWQWDNEDLIYNAHLIKEMYNDTRQSKDVMDDESKKRYKIVTFMYNKSNNWRGYAQAYSGVTETFTDPYDIELLDDFISSYEVLYLRDTDEIKEFKISRPLDLQW